MMRKYLVNGILRQYEEGTQPEGAVEEKKEEPKTKKKTPANKARKAATK